MSNPNLNNVYPGGMPPGDSTGASLTNGLMISEMPRGGMTGAESGITAGLTETEMCASVFTNTHFFLAHCAEIKPLTVLNLASYYQIRS